MSSSPFSALSDHVVYVAKPAFIDELCQELKNVSLVMGNLVFSKEQRPDICFALDVWLNPKIISFSSVSDAVCVLNAEGKYWLLNPVANVRRSHLIANQLRKLPLLEHSFPIKKPLPPIGCFSLLDQYTLVYGQARWKNPPLGDFHFLEDKKNPPNRAYLKLWEALSVLAEKPTTGDVVLDLGASPGGWSSVLHSLGARVVAVDKAPLDSRIARLSNLTFMQQSAFALDPKKFNDALDWLVCDIACYPERTYRLVHSWLDSGKAKKMIVTIKLQGKTDLQVIEKFKNIANSRVMHLMANKHEVTFFYPVSSALVPKFDVEPK